MIAKIIGYLLVVFGGLFFVKPNLLQARLKGKAAKQVRRILFAIALFFGILLISVTWKYHGLLPKIILLIGIIAILKSFYFLKAKSSGKAIEWMVKQPIHYFRIYAVVQVVIGLLMIFGLHK